MPVSASPYKVTSNSWEYTGDGHALALRAGATLINMEFVQFHPTGMVWPPSVKGLLVTESVRGDGGILKNSEGKRFMFDYVPDFFRKQTPTPRRRPTAGTTTRTTTAAPRSCCPATRSPGRSTPRSRPAAARQHGGVFLDIASRRTPEFIRKRLPSMYHQFKELADVDITAEPMEIGPTCHYVMGGVEVDPDTEADRGRRAVRRRRVLRRHARLQPARRQLAVRPAGLRQAGRRARGRVRRAARPAPADRAGRRRGGRARRRSRRSSRTGGENPYTIQHELQQTMNDLVGIIRTRRRAGGVARRGSPSCKERASDVGVEGGRQYNPGWHLALDLRNMLLVSECIAKAALERAGVARRAHPRRLPGDRPEWGKMNLVCSLDGDGRSAGAPSRCRSMRRTSEPVRPELELDEVHDRRGAVTGHHRRQVPRLARRRRRRRAGGLRRRGQRGRGRARRHPPAAGHPGRRPGRALELQGRQVRLVLGGDQRQAAADVHDPDVDLRPRTRPSRSPRCGPSRSSATSSPTSPSTTRRPARSRVRAAGRRDAGRVPDAAGRRRALAGVPQVHRVLPVPEHLPRHP